MIAAGSTLVILSLIYCSYILKRFRQTGFNSLNAMQKLDFLGNILIVLFFGFLGIMFVINNYSQ